MSIDLNRAHAHKRELRRLEGREAELKDQLQLCQQEIAQRRLAIRAYRACLEHSPGDRACIGGWSPTLADRLRREGFQIEMRKPWAENGEDGASMIVVVPWPGPGEG